MIGGRRGSARSRQRLPETLHMVSESWMHKMRTTISAAASTAKKKNMKSTGVLKPPPDGGGGGSAATIGILSFEVATAMSRAVTLYRSLSEFEITRLRSHTLAAVGVRHLVSSDEAFLLSLALAEKLDDLSGVAAVASRFGHRCSHPALLGFEHVYSDLLAGRVDPCSLSFLSKDNDGTIRKMERFVSSTAALYAELEVLTELEQASKKLQQSPAYDASRRAFDQKINWQRQDVKHLRDSSLWNQSFDKVALLLARAVCIIHSRIRNVFGEEIVSFACAISDRSCQLSEHIVSLVHHQMHSGSLRSGSMDGKSGHTTKTASEAVTGLQFHCGANPGRFFMECLSLGSSAMLHEINDEFENESYHGRPPPATVAFTPLSGEVMQNFSAKKSKFVETSKLTMLAAPSTVGGSALALHYANIIIIIEKLMKYPHLVGEDARNDLYQMLPSSLRSALKRNLKSYMKNLAIYDAPLAHDWKEALEKILSWLSPMAHGMIRWQTDRNFEQQQIIKGANVLLLQTLYFADREKTEAVVCELLVGLNYICRYEQQQNALLDCRSSLDFDDCMAWNMHCIR